MENPSWFYRFLFMKRNRTAPFFLPLITIAFLSACSTELSKLSGEDFLREHVEWLASDQLQGRLAGTINESESANYIADRFLEYGVLPSGDNRTYFQQFTLSGPMADVMGVDNHLSRNVVGRIERSEYPGRYIIVGAHYDGQGTGGMISMSESEEGLIHNSADDNASGTAGLLYMAKEIAQKPLRSSVLFVAFSGEELGLQGSRHFADTMEIEKDSVLAMINFDMIGRLDEGALTIFGTGTANIWEEILGEVQADSLTITQTPSGSGSSDHTSFYEVGIPVLHYFTGTHNDYHSETDTSDKINYKGMVWVLEYGLQTLTRLDGYHPADIEFIETTDPRSVVMSGDTVTLGVIPDYSYSGEGFRIESVQPDNPGADAGMQNGDIIIEMDGTKVADIYDYMELLNEIENGSVVDFVVIRNNEHVELSVQF